MDFTLEREQNICSAYLDSSLHLGIAQSQLLVQDGITECFQKLGCDGIVYRENFNAFWVFTRIKIKFIKRPQWQDIVKIKTFPINNAGVRTCVNTEIADLYGNKLILANQEACVLHLDTRRPMRLTNLPFPRDNFPEPVFNTPFEKFNILDATEMYEQRIHSQHIDMSKHTNNVEYTKFALNVFSDDFLQTNEVKEVELHYMGESREGELLKIFHKQTNDSVHFCQIRCGERTVFEMSISF